jgi:hypothetical protein
LKWKEEKLSLERVNELAIARLVAADTSRGERRADLSIDDILREATAEIEERANARLKVTSYYPSLSLTLFLPLFSLVLLSSLTSIPVNTPLSLL